MANQQIKRLLRRRPELDEAEFEILQSKVLARLRRAPDAIDEPAETPPVATETEPTTATVADPEMAALAPIDDLALNGHLSPEQAASFELADDAVGVMAEPGAALWESDPAPMPEAPADAEPRSAQVDPVTIGEDAPRTASSMEKATVAVMPRVEAQASQPVPSEPIVKTPKPRLPRASRIAKTQPRRRVIAPVPVAPDPGTMELESSEPAPETPAPKATLSEPQATAPEGPLSGPEATEPEASAPEATFSEPETAAPEAIVVTPTWLAKATTAAKARPGRGMDRSGSAVAAPVQQVAATEAAGSAVEAPEPEASTAEPVLTSSEGTAVEPASFEPTVATPSPRLAQAARAAKARLRRRTPWPITLDPEPEASGPQAPDPEAPEPEGPVPEVSEPVAAADPAPVVANPSPVIEPSTPRSAKPAARRPAAQGIPRARLVTTTPAAVAAPYCPYCALLLDPPPEATRRCLRCRERIIVKHVDGRTIYLTEASVLVFDAERRRMASAGRWTRERGRWLKVAADVGAPAERIAKLEAAPLSDELVQAAHALYSTTVDRTFRTAKRERRWDDASRIMREHAQVLFKLAGSPIPPPEESIRAHQQAAMAALHGVAEMARDAELIGARCCDICATDHGQTFRIASELRTPRLPHAGCPKGLCRCDWYLAVRDQGMVRRHLRRRARAEVPVADGSV